MKVLYDYEAQDMDEISLKEGELIELVKEGPLLLKKCHTCNSVFSDKSGWWTGKSGGNKGFFPGAYVEKVSKISLQSLEDRNRVSFRSKYIY